MKTIAVTGASGFIGGRLATRLFEQGHRVLAFGRRKTPKLRQDIPYRTWDITSGVLRLDEPVDAVIHCAGSVSDWGSSAAMYRANVVGTRNTLATFKDTPCFIHISTASVYDHRGPKLLLREDSLYPAKFLNAYCASKALAEIAVRQAKNPHRIIVRPHIVYGPEDTTLLPRLLRARRLERFLALGDGSNQLSLTYIENLAAAIDLILARPPGSEVINICDARVDNVDNILSAFLAALEIRAPLLHINKHLALLAAGALETIYKTARLNTPPLITRYAVTQMAEDFTLSLDKARRLLGYNPQYDYLAGFSAISDWLKSGKPTG